MHLWNPITPRTGRQGNKKQQPECGQLNLSLIRDQYDILQSALRRQGSGFYTYCPCIPRRIRSVAFLSFYSLVSFFFLCFSDRRSPTGRSDLFAGDFTRVYFYYTPMEKTTTACPRPRSRRHNVARSAIMTLLGLAGLVWWDNSDNQVDLSKTTPVSDGFSWQQVFTISPLILQRLTG